MWFECLMCERLLPLYEGEHQSVRFNDIEGWICIDCADDLMREEAEEYDIDGPFEDSYYVSGQGFFSY